MKVRLLLNSRFVEAVPLEVRMTSLSGEVLVVANEYLEPRSTLEVDLLAALSRVGHRFQPSSVQVSFFGDKEMIQAWLLTSGWSGLLETPLASQSDESSWQWISFWDTRLYGEVEPAKPRLSFVNIEATPVKLTFDLSIPGQEGERSQIEIPALGTYLWQPAGDSSPSRGSVQIEHDGAPGQVMATGYLQGPRFLASLPLVSSSSVMEFNRYDSPTLPLGARSENRPILSLFNPSQDSGPPVLVRIALVDLLSGNALASTELSMVPSEVTSLDLRSLWPRVLAGNGQRGLRVQITTDGAPVMVHGISLASSSSAVTDIELIQRQKVHQSGTYPIPNLEENQVVTTLLNLGDTTAELFGHLSWELGEYALPAIKIAPGAAYRIDFQKLVHRAEADLRGRLFQPEDSTTYFQWLSRRGSSELIARTEIRPLDSSDLYGFNCFGCCEEWPVGGIEPGFATFGTGGQADFVPVEFIDTCAGTMGPFTAFPTSSSYASPLGWNYNKVWSNSETNQTVSFTGDGQYMWIDCTERSRTFVGDGPVVADNKCALTHHPGFDLSLGCCGTHGSNVQACNDCCAKELKVAKCRCDKIVNPIKRKACNIFADKANSKCTGPCNVGCP